MSLNYQYFNHLGNITNIYQQNILTNYRQLTANEGVLQVQKEHQAGIKYNFQNSIKLWFGGLTLQYKNLSSNSIQTIQITNNTTQIKLLPFENQANTLSFKINGSKYINLLKGTLKLIINFENNQMKALVNENLIPLNSNTFIISPSFDIKVSKKMDIGFQGVQIWNRTHLKSQSPLMLSVNNSFNTLGITYKPVHNLFIQWKLNHIANVQSQSQFNFIFGDVFIGYQFSKLKSHLQLEIQNFTNITSFSTFALTSNQLNSSNFDLRGRLAVFKWIFNF